VYAAPLSSPIQPIRVDQVKWVVADIPVLVEVALRPDGIRTHPLADPGCVVAILKVIETGDVVALLPAEAIILEVDLARVVTGDERGAAERKVFFVADNVAALVEFELR
jgi:hypothetical protein